VLVNIADPDCASNPPAVTAPANSHTDRVSTTGRRNPAADAAIPMAATSSANTESVASIGGGSGSRSRARTVTWPGSAPRRLGQLIAEEAAAV
jgi:hypothetical protein